MVDQMICINCSDEGLQKICLRNFTRLGKQLNGVILACHMGGLGVFLRIAKINYWSYKKVLKRFRKKLQDSNVNIWIFCSAGNGGFWEDKELNDEITTQSTEEENLKAIRITSAM